MVEGDIKASTVLDHWSQFLRCTICFSYLRDPHTLECGHTFCKGCLKRLAEVAKEDSPDVRLRRLILPCPTCRHPFPAKPTIKGRASTSIVLKHMVELWAKECKMLFSSAVVKLRSISTQTPSDTVQSEEGHDVDQDMSEEVVFSEGIRPMGGYLDIMMKKVIECSEDSEFESLQNQKSENTTARNTPIRNSNRDSPATITATTTNNPGTIHPTPLPLNESMSSISDTDDSSSSNSQAAVSGGSYSNVSMSDVFIHMYVPRLNLSAFTHGRVLLALIWCTYCVIIVGLAEAFLPYVILFTLFFFLIVIG